MIWSAPSAPVKRAAERELRLETQLAADMPALLTDKTLLTRSLLNVLNNALNFTPQGGLVMVSTFCQLDGARTWSAIAVSDTGPGVSNKDWPHLFELFYRGEASNNYQTSGTGVGLFVARRLLDALGGKIVVESQPGSGAMFTLWLPDGPTAHV